MACLPCPVPHADGRQAWALGLRISQVAPRLALCSINMHDGGSSLQLHGASGVGHWKLKKNHRQGWAHPQRSVARQGLRHVLQAL